MVGDKISYKNRPRGYGQGDVRLGESLEVSDDIYSLGFISQINDEIMDPLFNVITGELTIGEGEKECEGEHEENHKEIPNSINSE